MLDLRSALERVGGDRDILREVATLFLENAPKMLAGAQQAFQTKDAAGVARAAHTLKSSVALFDAPEAVGAARAVENAARSGDLARAGQHLAELAGFVATLGSELSSAFEQ